MKNKTVLVFVLVTFSSILVHELGHYIGAKVFGFNPQFEVNTKGLFVSYIPRDTPTWKEKEYVISAMGIIGTIPLFLDLVILKDTRMIPIIIMTGIYSVYEIVRRYKIIKKKEA